MFKKQVIYNYRQITYYTGKSMIMRASIFKRRTVKMLNKFVASHYARDGKVHN